MTHTHHFTLAHKHPSMHISANTWKFPFVSIASPMNTSNKSPNAPSTARRNVGCNDEPGVRIFENKLGDAFDTSDSIIVKI